nr:glycosyltransferase family 4 protein [Rubrivivax gelatinosus]
MIERVPPETYGGTERVVSYLTEALAAQGHEVTLFASGDSLTRATLQPMSRRSLRGDPTRPDWLMRHVMMVDRVFEQAPAFDVIHFHIDFLHYPLARRAATPSLTTMHGRLDLPELRPLHEHFRTHPLVSISEHQRQPLPEANWCATVQHGLPRDLYRFHGQPGDYFVFLGRISPEKRVDRAIEIAIACGVPLRIAAKVDPVDRAYFEHDIAPRLEHPLVRFLGEVGDREKNELLGKARALLFPIDWPEPFGLVMIEAFACGTPVLAYRCGSVPEVLDDGVTGFIVDDQAGAVHAARRIGTIDRRRCRAEFERRFTVERMASCYVEVYQSLLDGHCRRSS